MEDVSERGPGLARLGVMEGVVGGEEDEWFEGEEDPGVVSQQFGQECRPGAPGGCTSCSQEFFKSFLIFI